MSILTPEELAHLKDEARKREIRQNVKSHCTKIKEGIRKNGTTSGNRAIWELFQNAGDLARNGHAEIKISVADKKFTFVHKGKPFTDDTLCSLVKQVSSEDKENDNPDGGGDNGGGTSGGTQGSGTDSGNTSRQFTISVTSANTDQGTVTGGGTYSEGSRINVTATPKAGYQFDKWSDGNTSATRTVNVSKNESFVAQFKVAGSTEPGGSGDDDTPEYI